MKYALIIYILNANIPLYVVKVGEFKSTESCINSGAVWANSVSIGARYKCLPINN